MYSIYDKIGRVWLLWWNVSDCSWHKQRSKGLRLLQILTEN